MTMIPGGEVYGDIQRRIKAAEERLEEVRQSLRSVTSSLEENRTSESKDLARLAGIRFNELEGKRVARGLDTADREVLTLLQHKRAGLEQVENELVETQRDQMTIESGRARLRAALDEALARQVRAVEAVQAQLAQDESYLFQRARTERAAEQAGRAAQKATQAESDRKTKGLPYENDRLFSYLWKRRYKFEAYRANLITRALDKWVAKLCKYDNAHRDYAMLLEIPIRLREHAALLGTAAEAEAAALAKMEEFAHVAAGLPALQEEIESRGEDLTACEETLTGAEERLAALRVKRAQFDADEDEHTLQAIAVLAGHMAREPIASLRADAVQSQTAADDAVVANIDQLRSQREDLEPRLVAFREQQAAALRSLEALEEVRGTFRKREYDADDSVFEDGPRTGSLLRGLLQGALVVAEVLSDMKGQQRFERPSGGSRRSGGWNWGGGSSSGGSWGGNSSGGSSSGGGSSSHSSSSSSGGFRTIDRF